MSKTYPKITKDNRKIFVRYPVQVTERMQPNFPCLIEVGMWVAVDVLESGYSYLLAPNPFKTFEECKKACDISNEYHGFSEKEAMQIIDKSMKASAKQEELVNN